MWALFQPRYEAVFSRLWRGACRSGWRGLASRFALWLEVTWKSAWRRGLHHSRDLSANSFLVVPRNTVVRPALERSVTRLGGCSPRTWTGGLSTISWSEATG